jgi:DNA-binding response OmpR family regulator
MKIQPGGAQALSIVVVEDHDALRQVTVDFLQSQGYRVVGVPDGETLDECLASASADVVMLDLNLPGEDGLSICRRLRANSPTLWIVMLTARTGAQQRTQGYQDGADIYLSKPASNEELAAALAGVARRIRGQVGNAALQLCSATLSLAGPLGQVRITDAEMKLLRGLALAANRQLEHWQLLALLGLDQDACAKSALEVRIVRLRRKLVDVGSPEPAIKSLRSIGYQLLTPVQMA